MLAFLQTSAIGTSLGRHRSTSTIPRNETPNIVKMSGETGHKLSRRAMLLTTVPAAFAMVASPVLADRTAAAAKVSYDRYHPRMLDAIEKVRQIGEAVAVGNTEAAAALINDKVFQVKSRRAFSIYATSFSDNYLNQDSRKMIKSIDKMYSELEKVAAGTEMKEHYDTAIGFLKFYYKMARLPSTELTALQLQT